MAHLYMLKINFIKIYMLKVNYLVFSNPFSCLSVWGGPVSPGVVLGGFLSPGEPLTKSSKFHRANALILTFLVDNHHDKEKVI